MFFGNELKDLLVIVAIVFVVSIFVVFPFAWFDGHAKARWIKETKGVDVPWYEATFLSVEINTVDAEVTSK